MTYNEKKTYVPWSNELSELLYEEGFLHGFGLYANLLFPTLNPAWHRKLKEYLRKELL